ncbi:MAG: hypothetical protein FWD71_18335, partial [Oscillospiraceae bacterium]|nr:hypothetical protein [Oscillospiraceae bacterium]
NVWQKVTGPTVLGPLTGGGPDRDPTTNPVTQIYDNTANDAKYYVGPLGPDSDGNYYYYGDPKPNSDNSLDSTADNKYGDDVIYYKDDNGNMTTAKPTSPITDMPTIADDGNGNGGRVLTDEQTGDGKWVEIARNGGYSLIVRANYINTYANGNYNNPSWQILTLASAVYKDSTVNKAINNWFNGANISGNQDKLSATAKLRQFTVQNNAISTPGTASTTAGMTNGFSKPTNIKIPSDSADVAFALSYSEVANFCSNTHDIRNANPETQQSVSIAKANFAKITIPASGTYNGSYYNFGAWLRSPGDVSGTMGALDNTGRAFQFHISGSSESGLVYPALWVDSAIFDPVLTPEQVAIGNASIDSTVKIDSIDWYVKQKDGDYAFLVAKNYQGLSQFDNSTRNSSVYEGSVLQNSITSFYNDLKTIKAIAVLPQWTNKGGGNQLTSTTDKTEHTTTMAGSVTKDVCFALSQADLNGWSKTFSYPGSSHYWTRTALTSSTVGEVNVSGGSITADSTVLATLNIVPGIWVKLK